MKKIISSILFAAALHAGAVNYFLTNDLSVPFNVFAWTNSAGTNFTVTNAIVQPNSNTVFSVSTNGVTGIGLQATNASASLLVPFTNAPFGGGNVSTVFTTALALVRPPVEIVPQVQSILKSYFVTGATPSQANYWELIDTEFWYVLQCYTNAVSAANSATAAQTVWRANGGFVVTNSGTLVGLTPGPLSNISSITVTNIHSRSPYCYLFTANFSTPLGGTNYAVNFSAPAALNVITNITVTGPSTTTVSYALPTNAPCYPQMTTNPVYTPESSVFHPFSPTNFQFFVDCQSLGIVNGLDVKFTVE